MHDPVPKDVSFAALEEEILGWWREAEIPAKALRHREGANEFVFYEGPPTANNPPHIGNMLTRAYKDVYPRYQSMKGRHVPRKAGWDCHGLPVELEMEKKLGFTQKRQIEEYGIERFNSLCRESVTRYVSDWQHASERMAFWLDYEDAYLTMSNEYIESVWWSLAALHRKGLLYEGDKVTPWCPRCETPLSDHEVALGYREVSDPSVTLVFPLVDPPGRLEGASLAVWTTTPWTLISNLAAAVHPDVEYALAEADGRRLLLAQDLVGSVLGEEARVLGTMPGRDLVGLRYEPPFSFAKAELADAPAWRVIAAEFVNTHEGTGIVHLAPAFGADDLEACRAEGIPTFNPVDGRGRFDSRAPAYEGQFVKDADSRIVESLAQESKLLRSETYLHSYPHCWRCDTPLLYYARTSWYIRTTEFRERLLEVNAGVNWVPEHIRDGRYGDWLANNVDWSLSRYRYWGTPLPIWRCPQKHDTAIESASDLGKRAGKDLGDLDLHRPFVDQVTFDCPDCGDQASRVLDLIDVWYDSGAMPFAQYGYPHHNVELFRRRFPADFIAEAIDQTRGWFYSLMAEGMMLYDDTAYRNVICLEFILDDQGRKMSKSLGNVVDPLELFHRFGADATRFWLLTSSAPATVKRVSFRAVEEVVRSTILTLWNVYRLYVLYANVDEFDPNTWAPMDPRLRPPLDRWALSELHQTISEVDEALDTYDCTRAGRRIAEFVEDLSNWYVRRSRRRFWREAQSDEEQDDKSCAYWTLWTCLVELSKVMAPFTPYLSEAMYRNLVLSVNPKAPESVHLTDFPEADARLIDPALAQSMAIARELVSLGRSARTDAKVKVRQPLAEAVLLVPPEDEGLIEEVADLIADELNVEDLSFAEDMSDLVRVTLRPNYRTAGPEFGDKVRALAEALASAGPMAAEVASTLEEGQDVEVDTSDGTVRVSPEHVEIRREPAAGTAFAYEAPYGVSFDLTLTGELKAEGLARELVHQLQNLRKDIGLDVTDRVVLLLDGPSELLDAVREHEEYIAEEVLATELKIGEPGDRVVSVDGHEARVAMEKAEE